MRRSGWSSASSGGIVLIVIALSVSGCINWQKRQFDSWRANYTPPPYKAKPNDEQIRPEAQYQVRVYVDEGYRDHVPAWQFAARRRFDGLATYLRTRFHIHLNADAPAVWPHKTPPNATMDQEIAALRQFDRGDGAEWVVLLVGRSETEEGDSANQVRASRYIAVRPGFERAEFRGVDGEEVARMLEERAQHRELTYLLRAWARSLGVPADAELGYVMAPRYDVHQSEFSEASVRAIRIGLKYRTDWTPAGRKAWAQEMMHEIAAHPDEYGADAATQVQAWGAEPP